MNDLADQSQILDTGKTPAENPSGNPSPDLHAELAQEIRGAMPSVDTRGADGSGQFAKPPPGPRGRPRKPESELKEPRRGHGKAFSPPANVDAELNPASAGSQSFSVVQPQPVAPAVSDADLEECGKCLTEIHHDLYAVGDERVLSAAKKKIPEDALAVVRAGLLVEGRAHENIEKGFTSGIKTLSPGPFVVKTIKAGGFISALWAYHRTKMAMWNEVLKRLENLPDLQAKKETP